MDYTITIKFPNDWVRDDFLMWLSFDENKKSLDEFLKFRRRSVVCNLKPSLEYIEHPQLVENVDLSVDYVPFLFEK